MTDEIGLNIGQQCLRLCLEPEIAGLREDLKKRFEGYLATPSPDAVRIQVSSWVRRHRYPWQTQRLQPFEDCIKAALVRFPQTHPVEERLATARSILRHSRPQAGAWQNLSAGNGHANSLIFAMSGANLFFYQPRNRTACILLKKSIRKDPMAAGVINGTMFALSYLLVQNGGLLLHGCGFERDGKAVLLVGKSGAGKTTAAKLCRPDVCFADDGVVLVREGDRFFLRPSPFRQAEISGGPPTGSSRPLETIFLLEKHHSDQVSDLKKHEMMLFILRHAIHFFKYLDDGSASKGFETVRHLLQSHPVYRLQFTPGADLWKLISR